MKLLIVLFLLFLLSCKGNSQVLFSSIESLNQADTLSVGTSKIINFLVSNYFDNSECEKKIDSFVVANKNSFELQLFTSVTIVFYKKSAITTVENIKKDKKIIDRHSNYHDKIYEYVWSNGKFISRFKYEKGKIIEPKSVISVEDVVL